MITQSINPIIVTEAGVKDLEREQISLLKRDPSELTLAAVNNIAAIAIVEQLDHQGLTPHVRAMDTINRLTAALGNFMIRKVMYKEIANAREQFADCCPSELSEHPLYSALYAYLAVA